MLRVRIIGALGVIVSTCVQTPAEEAPPKGSIVYSDCKVEWSSNLEKRNKLSGSNKDFVNYKVSVTSTCSSSKTVRVELDCGDEKEEKNSFNVTATRKKSGTADLRAITPTADKCNVKVAPR
ncbi:MAG: hypothetical protein QOD75_1296 [Blastocatellia bacterium]|jgi:hypothetical protein|nr:hypothetical protein [Blastocatellia bacterium]